MDFFQKREKIFLASVTETLIIILFLAILLSSIKQRKIETYATMLGVETEEIEETIVENQKVLTKNQEVLDLVNADSIYIVINEHSYFNYENNVLNEFLDSLAQGTSIEEIPLQLISENIELRQELAQV
ncbi:MAG: hypothetical protein ACJ0RA_01715 [Candidatus Neomarinimicrobiota bacterium]